MKKILLPLAALLLGAGSAYAGANVYASALKVNDGKLSFVLNDAATKVVLNVIKNGETVATADLGAGVKGVNTVDMPSLNVEPGTYQWSLTASAAANTEVVQLTDGTDLNLQTSSARGIAVDMFPTSPAFGNVYVVTPAEPSKQGARVETGLYAFDSSLKPINETAYTGGIEWAASPSNPNNVAVAENGQVFICSWADNAQSGVFVAEPDDLGGKWESVFTESERDDNGLVTVDGVKIHGSVQDIALYGNGDKRILYTDDEDINGGNGDIFLYNIGTLASPWDKAPSATWGGNTTGNVANGNHRLSSDGRGGLWVSQYRWEESDTYPNLFHINANGVWDFKTGDMSIFVGGTPVGAMAANADGSLVAMADGDHGKKIVVAKVTYDENGLPTLEKAYEISASAYGTRPFDLAFDAVNNIYAVYNSDNEAGGVAAWALPAEKNEFTTPALVDLEVSASGIADAAVAEYTLKGGVLTAEAGAAVYTVAGVKVAEGTVIDTNALAAGVYVVRTVKGAFKIVK